MNETEITEINDKSTGRPHIALAMMKRGYVSSVQEAFNLYLGENKPCYAKGKMFTVQETIEMIHKANGVAIIAPPPDPPPFSSLSSSAASFRRNRMLV